MRIVLVLLLIAAVAAALTDQGRLMLTKAGAIVGVYPPALTIDVRNIDANLALSAVQSDGFQGIPMRCQAEPAGGSLGDTSCNALVSLINDIPAYNAAFFFSNGRLSTIRLAFQATSQPGVEQYIQKELAGGTVVTPRDGSEPYTLLDVGNGTLTLSPEVTPLDEVLILWSRERYLQ